MFNAHLSLCSLPLFLSPRLANLSPNDKRNATTAPKLNLLPIYRCCEEPTNGQDGSQHCRCEERLQEHLQHLLTNTDTPTNCIRDALGADADNTDDWVMLTTNGGKRGRRRRGARWEPMQCHELLARVSDH